MAKYRLYCLNPDGEVATSHWIDAASDDDAIQEAKRNYPATRCEIWLGKRLVAEFES